MSRIYPDEPARRFERPPLVFTDEEGREITIYEYADGPLSGEANGMGDDSGDGADADTDPETEYDALAGMYVAFDPADRAQGLPPATEEQIHRWLDTVLDDGLNVVAWHGTDAVGHATLVLDDEEEDAYELAIFVLHDYQHARIGSRLMDALLGYGQERGIERVWLTVERWNEVAIALYRKFGFETSDAETFEIEMALRL